MFQPMRQCLDSGIVSACEWSLEGRLHGFMAYIVVYAGYILYIYFLDVYFLTDALCTGVWEALAELQQPDLRTPGCFPEINGACQYGTINYE